MDIFRKMVTMLSFLSFLSFASTRYSVSAVGFVALSTHCISLAHDVFATIKLFVMINPGV